MAEFLQQLVAKKGNGNEKGATNMTAVLEKMKNTSKAKKLQEVSTEALFRWKLLYESYIAETGKSEQVLIEQQADYPALRYEQLKRMADCLLLQEWAASPHLKQELKARFEKDNSKAEESVTNGNIFYPSEVIKVLNSIFREKEAHMLREACYLPTVAKRNQSKKLLTPQEAEQQQRRLQ